MQTKHFPVEIIKSASGEYDARFVMSASSPDRVRDTIDPEAYKSVEGKPLIALWQHNPDQPIGRWENLKADGARLVGDIKLASTNLAQMVKQLIADNVPLGASIGFRGKAEPNDKGGLHFKTLELFECSIVSIPAHPRAMQIAKQFNVDLGSMQTDGDATDSGHPSDNPINRAKAAILAANRVRRFK